MALTSPVVLATNATLATSVTGSPSRDVQVGEFIVLGLAQRDTIVSVADNSSQAGTANSYTQDKAETGDPSCYIYSCKVTRKILSTDTFTATFNSSNLVGMAVLALPDAAASSQLDKTASTNSLAPASVYTSTAVATTAQADEYAIGVAVFAFSTAGAPTTTADSPWVLHYSPASGGLGFGTSFGSQVLTATGTPAYTGSWTVTEDGGQAAAIATYKGTAAAAASSALQVPTRRRRNPLLLR